MRRSIKSRRYLSAFDACDFFVNTPDQKPVRKIHDYCVLRHYPTRTGRCAGRRQRKARKAGVGARAAFACWWREGTVRRARCALRKCKWMYITRQDRADEANLGPGVHRTRERDGRWNVSERISARDLPDPVGDSSSAFLTGSWSGVGVGV